MNSAQITALAVLSGGDYSSSPDGLVIDAGDDIEVVLTEMDGQLVVSIRGTVVTDLDNWLTDLDALPIFDLGIGWGPRGFAHAARRIWPLILEHVRGRQWFITGHSLGGAIAARVAGLAVTDGKPPIGYALFEPACSGTKTLRVVLSGIPGYACMYGNDPVPLLPPLFSHPCDVTAIGHDSLNPFSCHSIQGVIQWLQAPSNYPAAN